MTRMVSSPSGRMTAPTQRPSGRRHPQRPAGRRAIVTRRTARPGRAARRRPRQGGAGRARASTAARRKAAGRTPVGQRGGAGNLSRAAGRARGRTPATRSRSRATLRTWVASPARPRPEEGHPVRAVGRRSSAPRSRTTARRCRWSTGVGGAGGVDGVGDADPDARAAAAAQDQRRGRASVRWSGSGPAGRPGRPGSSAIGTSPAAGRGTPTADGARGQSAGPVPPPTHIR